MLTQEAHVEIQALRKRHWLQIEAGVAEVEAAPAAATGTLVVELAPAAADSAAVALVPGRSHLRYQASVHLLNHAFQDRANQTQDAQPYTATRHVVSLLRIPTSTSESYGRRRVLLSELAASQTEGVKAALSAPKGSLYARSRLPGPRPGGTCRAPFAASCLTSLRHTAWPCLTRLTCDRPSRTQIGFSPHPRMCQKSPISGRQRLWLFVGRAVG